MLVGEGEERNGMALREVLDETEDVLTASMPRPRVWKVWGEDEEVHDFGEVPTGKIVDQSVNQPFIMWFFFFALSLFRLRRYRPVRAINFMELVQTYRSRVSNA
jgi:hypothetical protein